MNVSDVSQNKKMGFWSIFFLGINSIIGSGIFLLPNKAYADVGNASLIVILLNSFLSLTLALCFAEAASKTVQPLSMPKLPLDIL